MYIESNKIYIRIKNQSRFHISTQNIRKFEFIRILFYFCRRNNEWKMEKDSENYFSLRIYWKQSSIMNILQILFSLLIFFDSNVFAYCLQAILWEINELKLSYKYPMFPLYWQKLRNFHRSVPRKRPKPSQSKTLRNKWALSASGQFLSLLLQRGFHR